MPVTLPQAGPGFLQEIGALLSNGAIPSDTLIALTTEFDEPAQQDPNGRNHFPECYTTVFLRPTAAAIGFQPRSVQGRIESDGSALASTATSPAQLRAALLVALGINPFGADGFNEGSVVGGGVSGTSHLEISRSQEQRTRIRGGLVMRRNGWILFGFVCSTLAACAPLGSSLTPNASRGASVHCPGDISCG